MGKKIILLLNAYLPTNSRNSEDDYIMYIRKLSYLIAESGDENVCKRGDFNTFLTNSRYADLLLSCNDHAIKR